MVRTGRIVAKVSGMLIFYAVMLLLFAMVIFILTFGRAK